jgi:formiminotetrahydrofolate cyclodeaminase
MMTQPMHMNEQTVGHLLENLAAKSPTPGGGAVASVMAALAASLGRMVLSYSVGKKSLAAHAALHDEAMTKLTQATTSALDLAEEDARAYAQLNALWKLDRSDPKRIEDWPACVAAAIDAPRQVMHLGLDILAQLQSLVGTSNVMLKSDLAIAAILAEAAVRAGAWNVRINAPSLDDRDEAEQLESHVLQCLATAKQRANDIEQACQA